MYETLSARMDRVIKLAQSVARAYEQDYVGTEHLLLAILQEGTGMGTAILNDRGITLAKAKAVVDELVRASLADTWVFGRLPGTPHFRGVMAAAIEEARQLKSKTVCAEHLLTALAREEGSVASAALAKLGIEAPIVRAEITRRLEAGDEPCSQDVSGGG